MVGRISLLSTGHENYLFLYLPHCVPSGDFTEDDGSLPVKSYVPSNCILHFDAATRTKIVAKQNLRTAVYFGAVWKAYERCNSETCLH
jgi:hypothetical protein